MRQWQKSAATHIQIWICNQHSTKIFNVTIGRNNKLNGIIKGLWEIEIVCRMKKKKRKKIVQNISCSGTSIEFLVIMTCRHSELYVNIYISRTFFFTMHTQAKTPSFIHIYICHHRHLTTFWMVKRIQSTNIICYRYRYRCRCFLSQMR